MRVTAPEGVDGIVRMLFLLQRTRDPMNVFLLFAGAQRSGQKLALPRMLAKLAGRIG
jgi:hypothetical protein